MTSLLEVRDLSVTFEADGARPSRAVDGVSFDLDDGETLGLVGESGCGKTLTALSLVRLVEEPPARTGAGSSIRYRGEELIGAAPSRLRAIRGADIGFVFQEPMTSLNPVKRVGAQIAETIRAHEDVGREEARDRALDLLARVELPDPGRVLDAYPHELSGGMRQRALIAMAVSCRPSVLIADEPTTALDVTVQAQILALLASLQAETGMAMLLISHDLAVVSRVARRVAVMYAGRIVEEGPTGQVFASPHHPYSEGLLRAVPPLVGPRRGLAVIPGRVPDPAAWPPGCRFHPRCPYAWERCADEEPPLDDPVGGAGGTAGETVGGAGETVGGTAGERRSRCWLRDDPDRRARGAYAEVALGPPGDAAPPSSSGGTAASSRPPEPGEGG